MNEFTKLVKDKVPWCMLFANDIVLVDGSGERTSSEVGRWRKAL